MADWDKISRLSEDDAKKREAAFEAQMLAMLAKEQPAPPRSAPPVTGDATIRISVTAHGQTTEYDNLESVPALVRERILRTWRPAPPVAPPVMLPPVQPASSRAPSYRTALFLNLMLPGIGQIYLGQTVLGCVFGFSFLGCLIASLTLFVKAYSEYMQTASGNVLDAGNLEGLAGAFPWGMMLWLLSLAVGIHLLAVVQLRRSR